jgi:hypothetical protein
MHYPIAQKIVKLIRLLIYIYTKISSLRQPGRAIAHIILALLAIEAIRRVSFTSNSPFSETLTRYELSVQPDLDKPNCDPIDRNKLRENMGVQIDGRVYPPTLALSFNNSFNFTCLMQNSVTKRILVWIPFFASSTIKRDDDSLKKSNCPVTNCEVTHDRSKLRSSDMVYAHIVSSLKGPNKLPTHRPRAQRWIFGIYESPVHSPVFSQFNSYFNLSSTYSIHSDFPNFYRNSFDQQFVWRKNLTFNRSFNYAKDKSILAFALISNQWDKSKRLRVIEEMQAHMPVRLFGSVGETCLPGVDCKEYLVSEAKFYLAFENSVCDEYITEKFFDTLKHNIVPVVLGGGDYELHVYSYNFFFSFNQISLIKNRDFF